MKSIRKHDKHSLKINQSESMYIKKELFGMVLLAWVFLSAFALVKNQVVQADQKELLRMKKQTAVPCRSIEVCSMLYQNCPVEDMNQRHPSNREQNKCAHQIASCGMNNNTSKSKKRIIKKHTC
jgi:hypothetical protein